jgi:DNA-binding transcriptional LysR family regulator
MLNYNKLYYFAATVRCGSITKAAEELFLSQSTISTHIKDLELSLKMELFIRVRHKLILTDAGRVLYERVAPFYDDENNLIQAVKDASHTIGSGIVVGTVGADIIYRLPLEIKKFQKEYEGAFVEIRRMNLEKLDEALREGFVDAAFMITSPMVDMHTKEVFEYFTVERGRLVMAMSRDNPLAGKEKLSLDELRGCKFAVLNRHEAYIPYQLLQNGSHEAGYEPNIVAEFPFIEPMLTAISMSDMITPTSSLAPIRGLDNLCFVELEKTIPIELNLMWRRDHTNARLWQFVRYISEVFAEGVSDSTADSGQ